MKIDIRPLTPDLWPAFEDLFGDTGACNGCWCMYWRIGSGYTQRPRAKNKADFRQVVRRGPPPGLLAFDGELAVGWCQLTPRSALPRLDRGRFSKRVDEVPVWSISCFYVRKGYRKQGVTTALIAAALKFAKQAKAPALEAYPFDIDETKSTSTIEAPIFSSDFSCDLRAPPRCPGDGAYFSTSGVTRIAVAEPPAFALFAFAVVALGIGSLHRRTSTRWL